MPPSTISVATNATIHLLYQIASISYCSNASLTAFNCTPCLRSNSSVSDLRVFYSEKTDARAVTALVTPQGGKPFITLSWRGTETLENWIENLCARETAEHHQGEGCDSPLTFCASLLCGQQIHQDRPRHVVQGLQGAQRLL